MNILLVNPVHPATAHVSAVRAWRFAQELSALGHRVLYLTGARTGSSQAPISLLASHDWSRPLLLAPAEYSVDSSPPNRNGALRKIETAVRMLLDGGYQSAWLRAATQAVLKSGFRPDVVWATFGKMEALFAARRIARELHAPWVLDLKDNWDLFVPKGMRRLMARRLQGWSAATANSPFTQAQAAGFSGGSVDLVYSGVDDVFIMPAADSGPDPATFVVNLIGSLYFPERLSALFNGLQQWLGKLSAAERDRVALIYLGGDIEMASACRTQSGLEAQIQMRGYLPVEDMAKACRLAALNMYVAYPGNFHHKLLELLACNRPVLAYPQESTAAQAIAAQVGGEILPAPDAGAVAHALGSVHRRWQAGSIGRKRSHCQQYSWRSQTLVLQESLRRAAGN